MLSYTVYIFTLLTHEYELWINSMKFPNNTWIWIKSIWNDVMTLDLKVKKHTGLCAFQICGDQKVNH